MPVKRKPKRINKTKRGIKVKPKKVRKPNKPKNIKKIKQKSTKIVKKTKKSKRKTIPKPLKAKCIKLRIRTTKNVLGKRVHKTKNQLRNECQRKLKLRAKAKIKKRAQPQKPIRRYNKKKLRGGTAGQVIEEITRMVEDDFSDEKSLDSIKNILKGVNVNIRDHAGRTLLMAYSNGADTVDIIKYLLEIGADPTITDNKKGWTALEYAVNNDYGDLIKILLDLKKIPVKHVINAFFIKNIRPLARSLIFSFLFNNNKLNKRDYMRLYEQIDDMYVKKIILQDAIENNQKKLIEFVLSKDFKIKILKNAALSYSVSSNNIELTKWLLQKGVNIDYIFIFKTALMNAAHNGNLNMIKFLLSYGADPHIQDEITGKTAYDYANAEVKKYLETKFPILKRRRIIAKDLSTRLFQTIKISKARQTEWQKICGSRLKYFRIERLQEIAKDIFGEYVNVRIRKKMRKKRIISLTKAELCKVLAVNFTRHKTTETLKTLKNACVKNKSDKIQEIAKRFNVNTMRQKTLLELCRDVRKVRGKEMLELLEKNPAKMKLYRRFNQLCKKQRFSREDKSIPKDIQEFVKDLSKQLNIPHKTPKSNDKLCTLVEKELMARKPFHEKIKPFLIPSVKLGKTTTAFKGIEVNELLHVKYLTTIHKNSCSTPDIVWWRDDLLGLDEVEDKIDNDCKINKNVQFIMIPLTLYSVPSSHANMLLWDRSKNEVERFEPWGYESWEKYNPKKLDKALKEYFYNGFGVKYIEPIRFCPTEGFQDLQENEKRIIKSVTGGTKIGFCQAWSLWFVHLRLSNPHLSRDEVIRRATNYMKKQLGGFTQYIISYASFFEQGKKLLNNPIKLKAFLEETTKKNRGKVTSFTIVGDKPKHHYVSLFS